MTAVPGSSLRAVIPLEESVAESLAIITFSHSDGQLKLLYSPKWTRSKPGIPRMLQDYYVPGVLETETRSTNWRRFSTPS